VRSSECENERIVYEIKSRGIKNINELLEESNLNIKDFSDDNIFNLYKNRWTIEEFYKQLKHNFKFQIMKEYNDKSYLKNIYLQLTFLLLKNILIETYKSENNNKIKKQLLIRIKMNN
jgi:IS4 transposase